MASYLITHSSLSALSVSHPGAGAGELCYVKRTSGPDDRDRAAGRLAWVGCTGFLLSKSGCPDCGSARRRSYLHNANVGGAAQNCSPSAS